jgi:Pyridoxamine 5'-phosphate oxidase
MTWWQDLLAAEPEFAARVRARFDTGKHCTMATLRRDGSPRISGTEVDFDGGLTIGSMAGAVKALDLRRDPRLALHSPTVDPSEDQTEWAGEAKIAGRAHEVTDPAPDDGSHQFKIEITEVVLTRLGEPADHLVIESWHPDRGLVRRTRR